LGDAAGTVADCGDEATESTVGGQSSFQTAAEHRRVDVAAAQRDHHPARVHARLRTHRPSKLLLYIHRKSFLYTQKRIPVFVFYEV